MEEKIKIYICIYKYQECLKPQNKSMKEEIRNPQNRLKYAQGQGYWSHPLTQYTNYMIFRGNYKFTIYLLVFLFGHCWTGFMYIKKIKNILCNIWLK